MSTYSSYVKQTLVFHSHFAGLFNWDRWNGQPWKIESIPLYTKHYLVQFTNAARSDLEAVEMRKSHNTSQEVDNYLIAHHRAEWNVNNHLLPFCRLGCDINVVTFLLRTSPSRISRCFREHIANFDRFTFELKADLEDLRSLQTSLAHILHNPLLFKSRYKWQMHTKKAKALAQAIANEDKFRRSKHKEANTWYVPSFDRSAAMSDRSSLKIEMNKAKRQDWVLKQPYAVAWPFWISVSHVMQALRNLFWQFETLQSDLRSRQTYSMNVRAQEISDGHRRDWQRLRSLLNHLMGLRLYRAHRYPSSVSDQELQRGRALLMRFKWYYRRFKDKDYPSCRPVQRLSRPEARARARSKFLSRTNKTIGPKVRKTVCMEIRKYVGNGSETKQRARPELIAKSTKIIAPKIRNTVRLGIRQHVGNGSVFSPIFTRETVQQRVSTRNVCRGVSSSKVQAEIRGLTSALSRSRKRGSSSTSAHEQARATRQHVEAESESLAKWLKMGEQAEGLDGEHDYVEFALPHQDFAGTRHEEKLQEKKKRRKKKR